MPKSIALPFFCRQFEYNQKLFGIADSWLLANTSYIEANVLAGVHMSSNQFYLGGSPTLLGEDCDRQICALVAQNSLSDVYDRPFSAPPPPLGKGQKSGDAPESEQSGDPSLFGKLSKYRGRRRGCEKYTKEERQEASFCLGRHHGRLVC